MPFSAPEHRRERGLHTAVAPQADTAAPGVHTIKRRPAEGLRPSQVPARPPQEVLHGSGRPLTAPLREEMEGRFGVDFSAVRVHADSAASASAAELGARAYTVGDHVVVGDGNADKQTLAHELAHVLQQRRGPVAGTSHGDFRLSDPADVDERAAEATARRVMSGAGPEREAGSPGSGLPAGTYPAPGTPTIQRVIILGEDDAAIHYQEPPAEDSKGEAEEAAADFDELVRWVQSAMEDKEVDVADRRKISTLLRNYWKGGEIWADGVDNLVDELSEEARGTGRTAKKYEREQQEQIDKLLGTSKAKNTRAASNKRKTLASFADESVEELTAKRAAAEPPTRIVDPSKSAYENEIHTGDRNFESTFRRQYWEVWDDWAAKTKNPILCNVCHLPITKGQERSIDHVESWNSLKGGMTEHIVCKSGQHWAVCMQEEADQVSHDGSTDPSGLAIEETGAVYLDPAGHQVGVEAYMNRRNLQPVHKECNSEKNAKKLFDSVVPQRLGPPHDPKQKCGYPAAI